MSERTTGMTSKRKFHVRVCKSSEFGTESERERDQTSSTPAPKDQPQPYRMLTDLSKVRQAVSRFISAPGRMVVAQCFIS